MIFAMDYGWQRAGVCMRACVRALNRDRSSRAILCYAVRTVSEEAIKIGA